MSEMRTVRADVLQYCVGNGVDLGCGDEKITPKAIGIDLRIPYGDRTFPTDHINYHGDATDPPFKEKTLDYVFSSHLLEDFINTREILEKWCSLLKIGGHLILYLPIQSKYVDHCTREGTVPNPGHKVPMSPNYLLERMPLYMWSVVGKEYPPYSFLAIYKREK